MPPKLCFFIHKMRKHFNEHTLSAKLQNVHREHILDVSFTFPYNACSFNTKLNPDSHFGGYV